MYDVIVVGAGPAGLFSSLYLARNSKLKVLLVDEGKFTRKRVCPMNSKGIPCANCNPCNILSGYGGAGTFSDGKLNFIPKLGKTDLFKYMDKSDAYKLIDEVESISSVNLDVSDDTGKAILPADNSIYLYWKIQTAFNQTISLSWSENLSSNAGTLDWIVYTTPYGDGVDSGDSVVTSGAVVLNRNPSDNTAFKFGTAGCQKLTVVSEPVTDAGVGIYSGTLLLTIKNI